MPDITDFHAHIYFNPDELDQARALGEAVRERFGVPVIPDVIRDPPSLHCSTLW